jgi:hypothetical protein
LLFLDIFPSHHEWFSFTPPSTSPEGLQQLLAWYKICDTLFGEINVVLQDIKKSLELASVCGHPNAVWLTKLFAGRDVASCEEAREVFLGCESDPRALCFAAVVDGRVDEVHRAAELGNSFAQAWMVWQDDDEEHFRWAEKSAAQEERDGFCRLGVLLPVRMRGRCGKSKGELFGC